MYNHFQQTSELFSWQNNENPTKDDQDQNNEIIWRDDINNSRVESSNPRQRILNNNGEISSLLLSPDDNDDAIISINTNINVNINCDEIQNKKKIHRDVERQRRREMSQLYASLHSLLPLHYTKGKRSTSDHLEEAVNYIKDLERNIKELSDTRDQLKSNTKVSNPRLEKSGSSSTAKPLPRCGSVVILPRQGGLDIEITTLVANDDSGDGFCLSNALQVVFEEGFSVESCTSTNVHGTLLHQILCEIGTTIQCVDVSRLEQRLINLTN